MSTSHDESLRDIALIAQQRHDGVGGRAMQRIAAKAGLTMSPTTFDRIASGVYRSNPTEKTLQALAHLAGVSTERVFKAAGRPYRAAKFADQLPPDIDQLSQDQREAVIAVARAFLKTNKDHEQRYEESQQEPVEEQPPNVHQLREREDPQPEQKTGLAALERGLGEGIDPDATLEDS